MSLWPGRDGKAAERVRRGVGVRRLDPARRERPLSELWQGGATVSPKDYRTPYEKDSHKAYIQYKLDLEIAEEKFNKTVAPFGKEYKKQKKPIGHSLEEAIKPLAAAHDEVYK